jgi:hypothetical protein
MPSVVAPPLLIMNAMLMLWCVSIFKEVTIIGLDIGECGDRRKTDGERRADIEKQNTNRRSETLSSFNKLVCFTIKTYNHEAKALNVRPALAQV